MTTATDWFGVDRKGLAQLIGDRGKSFMVFELLQNAWDEASTEVIVYFRPTDTPGLYRLEVIDDNPEGFRNLTHAYTLFAPSDKKDDPTKRGRFNWGEKLVLALCTEAYITTTKGTVSFTVEGRKSSRKSTPRGTHFSGLIRMNRAEYNDAMEEIKRIFPPQGIRTVINDAVITAAPPKASITLTLPTIKADTEGVLRSSARISTVHIYEPRHDERGWLFEMGIPVVETGDRWHYDVQQKVPLNSERTDVTPAYKQDIRTKVLNEMFREITTEDANQPWVRDAVRDKDIAPEAVEKVMTERFGEKRVIFDPSDPEANKLAVLKGYTVIPPRSLSHEEWKNVRIAKAALPAGQVTPSPKPFTEGGAPVETLPQEQWTQSMWRFNAFANLNAIECIGHSLIAVRFVTNKGWKPLAAFGPDRVLYVNLSKLGKVLAGFERDLPPRDIGPLRPAIGLLIHEFAHYRQPDHLSEAYHEELEAVAAIMVTTAVAQPQWFTKVTEF